MPGSVTCAAWSTCCIRSWPHWRRHTGSCRRTFCRWAPSRPRTPSARPSSAACDLTQTFLRRELYVNLCVGPCWCCFINYSLLINNMLCVMEICVHCVYLWFEHFTFQMSILSSWRAVQWIWKQAILICRTVSISQWNKYLWLFAYYVDQTKWNLLDTWLQIKPYRRPKTSKTAGVLNLIKTNTV